MSTETPLEEVEQAQTVSKPVQAAYQTVEEQVEEAKQIAKESATAEKLIRLQQLQHLSKNLR